MKITREEFKEFIELYEEAWDRYNELELYYNTDQLEEMLFPCFDYIVKQLELVDEETGDDLFAEYHFNREYPVNWDVDDRGVCCNIEYTDDLDVIYDRYLGGHKENA